MGNARRRSRKGFTLIELLVVLVILGLLAALVAPRFLKQVGKGQTGAATAQIKNFAGALELYMLDAGSAPSTEQGLEALLAEPGGSPRPLKWRGPYMDTIPLDPWGNEYVYEEPGPNGEDFLIVSYGQDGKQGGSDDDMDVLSNDLGAA